MSKRGCCLWWVILAIGALFAQANATVDLAQFGTVTHERAGETHENPIALFAMIGIVAVMIFVTAVMLARAEKKAAEKSAPDDILVSSVAKAGCGTGLGMLAVLATCGLLAWIFAMVGSV